MPHFLATVAAAPLLIAALSASPAHAENDVLYSATVIVTGRDNLAERSRGFHEALPRVLTKVSVDGDVARRAVERGLIDDAEALVVGFDYRDRKEGIQISDEQGTRDRSFEFTVQFDPESVDALLRELGARPWRGPRPEIGVDLMIDDRTTRYRLTQVSEKGHGQRMAFADKADTLGLLVRLPEAEDIEPGSPVWLDGETSMTSDGYWDTQWHVIAPDIEESFSLAGTTFDIAFEEALRRTAQALAAR